MNRKGHVSFGRKAMHRVAGMTLALVASPVLGGSQEHVGPGPRLLTPCESAYTSVFWGPKRYEELEAMNFRALFEDRTGPVWKLALLHLSGPLRALSVHVTDEAYGVPLQAEVRGVGVALPHWFRDGVSPDYHQAALPGILGSNLASLFGAATYRVSYDDGDRRLVLDGGPTYEFISWVFGEGYLCGQVYEAEEGSPTELLVEIGEALFEYLEAETAARRAIETRIEDLIARAQAYFGCAERSHPPVECR